jgi:hypothetical protein
MPENVPATIGAAVPRMSMTEKQRQDIARVASQLRAERDGGEGLEVPPDPQDGPQGPPGPAVVPSGAPVAAAPTPEERAALGVPDWFRWPQGYEIPEDRRGTPATFIRLPTWLTNRPSLGERQCMLLILTPAESTLARARVPNKDRYQTVAELSKQMIRVVDGHVAEFFRANVPGDVHRFWKEIGPKAQDAIENVYVKMHAMNEEERTNFLASCIETRTVG